MGHDISKRLLAQATTFALRQKAIRAAMGLGMPLSEIEEYLDWLDGQMQRDADAKDRSEQEAPPTGSPRIPPPHTDRRGAKKPE